MRQANSSHEGPLEYPINKSIVYYSPFSERGASVAWLRSFMQEHDIGSVREPDAPRASRENMVTAGGVEIVEAGVGEIGSLVCPPVPMRRAR